MFKLTHHKVLFLSVSCLSTIVTLSGIYLNRFLFQKFLPWNNMSYRCVSIGYAITHTSKLYSNVLTKGSKKFLFLAGTFSVPDCQQRWRRTDSNKTDSAAKNGGWTLVIQRVIITLPPSHTFRCLFVFNYVFCIHFMFVLRHVHLSTSYFFKFEGFGERPLVTSKLGFVKPLI